MDRPLCAEKTLSSEAHNSISLVCGVKLLESHLRCTIPAPFLLIANSATDLKRVWFWNCTGSQLHFSCRRDTHSVPADLRDVPLAGTSILVIATCLLLSVTEGHEATVFRSHASCLWIGWCLTQNDKLKGPLTFLANDERSTWTWTLRRKQIER